MNLSELLPSVASMSYAELAALVARIPAEHVPAIMIAQDEHPSTYRLVVSWLIGEDYMMSCDVLKDIGPLYPAELWQVLEAVGADCPVVAQEDARADILVHKKTPFTDYDNPPDWVQPLGAHDAYAVGDPVHRNGYNYKSLARANVWEPTPQSTLWQIYPDPGPLPWVQPTGSANAYGIGDVVTHIYPGRTETIWQSNIDANTTEPGGDGTFDRWWKPLDSVPPVGPQPWQQPLPGVWPAYAVGAVVTHNGSTWNCTFEQNVWEPGVFGWEEETPGK